ncbi:MAG TPA: hypothetical protein VF590_18475 [Isosphaeraceae bacterium]|jgi:hypothetical protein
MLGWLRQADQEGILKIFQKQYTLNEEGIGFYEVNGLTIRLGAREVRVVPVARQVIGPYTTADGGRRIRAQGLIDLENGEQRFRIYRFTEPDEHWVIVDEDRDDALRDFDQEAFEIAIQRMLE